MRTILLDIDDTLLDFHQCAKYSIKKSEKDYNVEFTEEMYDRYFAVNIELWGKYENGIISREDIFNTRFPIMFKEYGIDVDGIEFENKFQEHFKTTCVLVDGAEDFLKYLSSKYDVYAASNSMLQSQISRLKTAKLDKYFKGYFVSDAVGAQKPTKEFFEYCFKNIPNFDKEKAIIIGDSLSSDIQGANNVGLKCCWFNPKNEENKTNFTCTYEIKSLDEIKNIL